MTSATSAAIGSGLDVVGEGTGPVVGYLHGILGTPAGLPFVSTLADQGRRVTAPNLPGFGGSEALPCRNMLEWVGCLSEIVDECGLAGRPLVASSVGAMVAVELAALRPEAFEQLILVAPFGLWLDEHPIHDVWSERTPRQPEWLVNDPAVLAPFEAVSANADSSARVEAELRRYRTRRSAASIMWPIPDRGLADRLHRVRCPVHIVWGGADRLIDSRAYAGAWSARLPRPGLTRVVEEAGHLVEWDAPAAVAEFIAEALR